MADATKTYEAREDGFFPLLERYAGKRGTGESATRDDVRRVLRKKRLNDDDVPLLLSPAAGEELESLARRAQGETLRHFGKARQLFAPLYLGNYCANKCVYCGFHAGQKIARKALNACEIEEEAKALAATGLRRVLALTGDAPGRTGAGYIAAGVAILAKYFPSVGIEVQALTGEEYGLVARAGADSMTMFQETYDRDLYSRLHLAGPKRNFAFRLDAPQRAAEAGMRGLCLGALLGLGDWRFDIHMLAMHGQWLQTLFPELELSFSLPRIRPRSGEESRADVGTEKGHRVFDPQPVSDRDFVQAVAVLRCFLPHAGITLSTRERAELRDSLLPIGVTRVSAGVCTSVGGYARRENKDDVQFVIDDQRGVDQMVMDMQNLGFQPVFADWLLPLDGTMPLADALSRSLGGIADAPRGA
jgi:2-iminoacetate synthase